MYSRKRSSRLNLWRRNLRDRVHCEVDQRRQRKNLLSAFAKWCENVLNYVRMVCPLVNCFYHMFKSCLSELRGVADVYVEVLEHFSCHVCRVLKHLRSFYPSVYVRMSCTPGGNFQGWKAVSLPVMLTPLMMVVFLLSQPTHEWDCWRLTQRSARNLTDPSFRNLFWFDMKDSFSLWNDISKQLLFLNVC